MAALIPIAANVGGFALKHWTWFAMAGLGLTLAVQGQVLSHTRHDLAAARAAQVDTRSCVAGKPCKGAPKWQAEVIADEADIARLTGDFSACTLANAHMSASIDALQAASDASTAAAAARLATARAESRTALQRAQAALAARPGADRCQSADDVILRSLNP